MHNAAFKANNINAEYTAVDVDPEKLMDELYSMQRAGFGGVNLTIPLKEIAFRGLDDLDDSARSLGAVNTVEFIGHGMKGYNTDGKGFLNAIQEAFDVQIRGLSIFILGGGGAGRALAITCARESANLIAIADIDTERSERILEDISVLCPNVETIAVKPHNSELEQACAASQLIIQATPVGMKEDDSSPLQPSFFNKNHMLLDLIYMYPETVTMQAAGQAGAMTSNGLGMLLHQGALAFSIWTKQDAPLEIMRKALEEKVYTQ
jgi:shikimate dehydrogenase